MITYTDLQKDTEIQVLLKMCDTQLENMGYTDHGELHRQVVCRRIEKILRAGETTEEEIYLGQIAGYLHDIGCAVNRHDHAHSGALLVYPLLLQRGLSSTDTTTVINAIANHDEKTGYPCTKVAAALILADKSDVHRNRVRRQKLDENLGLLNKGDIHDRVNYSVIESALDIDQKNKKIIFRFAVDSRVASAMEYFEIFLGRMKMCKNAAEVLGYEFNLEINKQILA